MAMMRLLIGGGLALFAGVRGQSSLTGIDPNAPRVGNGLFLEEREARYRMTWPSGKKRVTKMSDYDVAGDPACDRQPHSPVKWGALRLRLGECLASLKRGGEHCEEAVRRARKVSAFELDTDTRYSTWRNDCYLGFLAMSTCTAACSMRLALMGSDSKLAEFWPHAWQKMQLELEGLWFYLELPWSTMLLGRFHLPGLLNQLGFALRQLSGTDSESGLPAGIPVANQCDEADSDEDKELLTLVDDNGVLPLHKAQDYIAKQGADVIYKGRVCSFGIVVALLTLSLFVLRNGVQPRKGVLGDMGGYSVETLIDQQAQYLARHWEESTPQFFFDLLTSHWRMFEILELLGEHWVELAQQEEEAETSTDPLPAPKRRPQSHQQVLFLGGGESTFQWGSFTVRGRQAARGLRRLGVDARAWNSPCQAWCDYAGTSKSDAWTPTAIVHIKFPCECAVKGWRRSAVHLFDPIDEFAELDAAPALDALLVQTSLAQRDLLFHPPLRAAASSPSGRSLVGSRPTSVFWLPIHHGNEYLIRKNARKAVHKVGFHTVHHDQALGAAVERALQEVPQQQQNAVKAEFVHLDPAQLFHYADGRVTTPQQTYFLYEQLALLDVGIVRQSGCLSDWWFCSRWKTPQRLVNMLSVGVPAIIFGDAQGHADVAEARFPPPSAEAEGECAPRVRGRGQPAVPDRCVSAGVQEAADRARQRRQYPRELIVHALEDVPRALALLLSNATLRQEASDIGLEIAAPFSLPRMSRRLLRIVKALTRRLPPRCRAERWQRRPGDWRRLRLGTAAYRSRWRRRRHCR
eukprot:TRINITY_DN51546_c0_g1_i1.p1 TRINITY_DN51546_c0_g1~~TRINITY_DN51546_c0_g1_i1.p1  ORF type:complete len:803 (-),score=148.18 TRINITY_DN51546_c0_g1_i1:354-2762(-)